MIFEVQELESVAKLGQGVVFVVFVAVVVCRWASSYVVLRSRRLAVRPRELAESLCLDLIFIHFTGWMTHESKKPLAHSISPHPNYLLLPLA